MGIFPRYIQSDRIIIDENELFLEVIKYRNAFEVYNCYKLSLTGKLVNWDWYDCRSEFMSLNKSINSDLQIMKIINNLDVL